MCLEERIQAFLNRKSFSKASFEAEGIDAMDQVVICGPAGSGTSTLARRLGEYFGYKVVSGGNYQRKLTGADPATPDEQAILELTRRNAADPKKGTDSQTETWLFTQHILQRRLVMEARNGHFITGGRACRFLLTCNEEVRAQRVFETRLKAKGKTMEDARAFIRERDKNDKRFSTMYPGSDSPDWDFHTIDTERSGEDVTFWLARGIFISYRQQLPQLEEMLVPAALAAERSLAMSVSHR